MPCVGATVIASIDKVLFSASVSLAKTSIVAERLFCAKAESVTAIGAVLVIGGLTGTVTSGSSLLPPPQALSNNKGMINIFSFFFI